MIRVTHIHMDTRMEVTITAIHMDRLPPSTNIRIRIIIRCRPLCLSRVIVMSMMITTIITSTDVDINIDTDMDWGWRRRLFWRMGLAMKNIMDTLVTMTMGMGIGMNMGVVTGMDMNIHMNTHMNTRRTIHTHIPVRNLRLRQLQGLRHLPPPLSRSKRLLAITSL